jgi:hypothetical protein
VVWKEERDLGAGQLERAVGRRVSQAVAQFNEQVGRQDHYRCAIAAA